MRSCKESCTSFTLLVTFCRLLPAVFVVLPKTSVAVPSPLCRVSCVFDKLDWTLSWRLLRFFCAFFCAFLRFFCAFLRFLLVLLVFLLITSCTTPKPVCRAACLGDRYSCVFDKPDWTLSWRLAWRLLKFFCAFLRFFLACLLRLRLL